MRETTRVLPCTLTEQELKQESRKLTELLLEKGRLEEAKASQNRYYAELIKDIDSRIEEQIPIVQYNRIERAVRCEVIFNCPNEGLKKLTRTDTGETLEIEQMTEDEINDLFIASEEDQEETENAPVVLQAADICDKCGAVSSGNKVLELDRDRNLCLICIAQANDKKWASVMAWHKAGHQVLYRAGCWNGVTTFRFMGAGHSWGQPIYKEGDYQEAGSLAAEFYKTLQDLNNFKED